LTKARPVAIISNNSEGALAPWRSAPEDEYSKAKTETVGGDAKCHQGGQALDCKPGQAMICRVPS
jgi:hypothetical protein